MNWLKRCLTKSYTIAIRVEGYMQVTNLKPDTSDMIHQARGVGVVGILFVQYQPGSMLAMHLGIIKKGRKHRMHIFHLYSRNRYQ